MASVQREKKETGENPAILTSLLVNNLLTGLPASPVMGFRSSVSKSGHPGEEKQEDLVCRNDVLTNGFIGFSLA